jgi:hypothetical protein
MADLTAIDNNALPPGFFGGGGDMQKRYSNPYYNVSMQFLPLNVDMQLWWAEHFLFRFGFYFSTLKRVSNYFITSLQIECDDPDAKVKYQEIFEELKWKEALFLTGINLLAYGNTFASISQGFDRFLKCPECGRITNIEKINDYEFSKEGKYTRVCPQCKNKGVHEVMDKSSKDVSRLEIIFWRAREIIVRFERTTNAAEYYWNIPAEYATMVTKPNNQFFSKKTPKAIYDAIYNKKLLALNQKNFIHLKVPTPAGVPTEGKAIPFCIYLFDEFFFLKVLERFNESIMFEDIIPFRVFSMAQQGAGNAQINPIIHQSAPQWQAGIKRMIQEHRQDPGAYQMFPFQFNYEHLGGDGTKLAPTELIQNSIGNILNALNIPQELYTMTLQTQAVGPALRLFENSWSFMIDTYNTMLTEWGDIVSKIQGLPKAKIKLTPVTLSDDIERKSVIGQLVSANAIAQSELLKIYNMDFRTQLKQKMEEDQIRKELQDEQALKDQVTQMADAGSGQQQGGSSPSDVLQQAQQLAQQLFPMDAAGRRTQLQQIKATNQTLYAAVKSALEQMTSGAKSQGVQGAKQQSQQGGQGQ